MDRRPWVCVSCASIILVELTNPIKEAAAGHLGKFRIIYVSGMGSDPLS